MALVNEQVSICIIIGWLSSRLSNREDRGLSYFYGDIISGTILLWETRPTNSAIATGSCL